MKTNKAAESVGDFCQSNGISKSMFYKMQREGKGPRIMKIGRRTLISQEASAKWRKNLEAINGLKRG
jgi:predicted DNA-binding transcriptional regulator AlpA